MEMMAELWIAMGIVMGPSEMAPRCIHDIGNSFWSQHTVHTVLGSGSGWMICWRNERWRWFVLLSFVLLCFALLSALCFQSISIQYRNHHLIGKWYDPIRSILIWIFEIEIDIDIDIVLAWCMYWHEDEHEYEDEGMGLYFLIETVSRVTYWHEDEHKDGHMG